VDKAGGGARKAAIVILNLPRRQFNGFPGVQQTN